MKKKLILSLFIFLALFFLSGCGNTTNQESLSDNENNITTDNDKKSSDEFLAIVEVNKKYDNDLPLGLETNYVKLNGHEIVIRIQTSGSSKQQENGPYYIYYNVYVGNDDLGFNCIRDAIYHLEGYGITMLKEFDEEEDAGVNHEFFEWDFTSSAHKGGDKEYVAISIPAGIEDKNQASMMITTDNGRLLADFIADIVHGTVLSGPDVDKYKNHSGDFIFHSIKDGNITYLTPIESMYKTVSGKKVLDSSLDVIELEEHSVTMNNNKATDTKTGNIYKITNATGKTYNFSEFRHL